MRHMKILALSLGQVRVSPPSKIALEVPRRAAAHYFTQAREWWLAAFHTMVFL